MRGVMIVPGFATKEITGVVCKNKSLVSLKYSINA